MEDNSLAHHGVKGMRWGVRRNRTEGVPAKTDRMAAKDAKEHARAKMYYGEGAGVRRRLINNTVTSRSKDPAYAKAFENHRQNQDLAKAASKAHTTRKRTDAVNSTKKTVRGIGHVIRGNARYASLTAASIAAGGIYVHQKGYDKMAYTAVKNSPYTKKAAEFISGLRG